jgi:hypothetical protein
LQPGSHREGWWRVTFKLPATKQKGGMMKTYSNPRLEATIENWPSGSKRVTAVFSIEIHPNRGQRAVRKITGAAKKLTYATAARIVDGDDGRSIPETDPRHQTIRAFFN